jgi:adenylate cyclase
MLSGLQSFARYVPIEVVRELLRRGEVAQIGGRTEVLTVLFTDIRGFTTIAERMSPETLTAQMAEYFDGMLKILHSNKATVDKFVGDAVVAFWGAPSPDANHAEHAVKAVLDCVKQLHEFNHAWEKRGLPALPTCFGLNTGPVVVGNVGAPSRLSYTALGDTVNLASRLESLNRTYGTGALASQAVRDAAGRGFLWRQVDLVAVKGKSQGVKIYEALGQEGEVAPETLAFAERYEKALQLYQSRKFRQAPCGY